MSISSGSSMIFFLFNGRVSLFCLMELLSHLCLVTVLSVCRVLIYILILLFFFNRCCCDVIQAVDAALSEDNPNTALILSLRLNEDAIIKKCIFWVSPVDIPAVASSIPYRYLQRLIEAIADLVESCPHLEFILRWCQVYSS